MIQGRKEQIHSPDRALGQACGVLSARALQTDATTAAAAGGGPARPLFSCVAAAATSSGVKHVASRRLSACSVAKRTPSDSACSSGTSAWKAPGRRSPARPLSTSCSLHHRSAFVNVLMPNF